MINIYKKGWDANRVGTDMPDAEHAHNLLLAAGWRVTLHEGYCGNQNLGVDWCTDYECAAVDAVCEGRPIPE